MMIRAALLPAAALLAASVCTTPLQAATAAVPGPAKVSAGGGTLALENGAVRAAWNLKGDSLTLGQVRFSAGGATPATQSPAFVLELGDGAVLSSAALRASGAPAVVNLPANPAACVFSERLPGKAVELRYSLPEKKLELLWRAILRDGSPYVRQELVLTPKAEGVVVRKLAMLQMELPGTRVAGTVRGSPVVTENLFLAIEHPAAESRVTDSSKVECSYSRGVPLPAGKPFVISAVIGGAENGQLRRAFNQYTERERAHAYRQFPHYNSWFHLNIDRPKNRMTEAEAVQAVNDIGAELTVKRGFALKAYVMDDGWDSHEKVWEFNENFPRGFTNVAAAAAKYKAGIGLWMSPFGGYGEPHNTRVRFGSKAGFETNASGLSMAGKNYQAHFLKTTLGMIRNYRACFFKFDGMGGGNFADGGDSAYANDMDAMFNVILRGIRQANPNTYISATVGTWPSPFWLRYADSIWRQGSDTDFTGAGNGREKWITYRDAAAYDRIVRRGPLYPISALMLHGIVISDRGNAGRMTRDEESVRHEARSFFGTGTSLQELYLSPNLLTPAMWDAIAASGKWAQRNQDCLMDSHWIGGDPGKLEVYGFASWIPGKGTLTLRNPSDKPQAFRLDIATAFELPESAPKSYKLVSPYKDQSVQTLAAEAGKPQEITLQPFEVLVFDATPAGR